MGCIVSVAPVAKVRKGIIVSVIVLSNANKTFPIWFMKNASEPGGLVVWDYHVIAVERREQDGEEVVWDLDCALGFGIPFHSWATKSLRPGTQLREQYHQMFRVVSAADYLAGFASDRSHMRDATGEFKMPPPPQPCIVAKSGETHTLPKWWDMTHKEPGYGKVHDVKGLLRHFGVTLGSDLRDIREARTKERPVQSR